MPLRDTLLRVAEKGFCRIHFSQEILDGATRNLIKDGRMDQKKASRLQSFLTQAFPEALISVPDSLVAAMTNDPGDRHVLAAAVVCQAEIIVTTNLKHFQPQALTPWNVEAQHPDSFLVDLCHLCGTDQLAQVIQEQHSELTRKPITLLELLEKLQSQVPNFAKRITTHIYGEQVRDIAKSVMQRVQRAAPDLDSYSGTYYELFLKNRTLTILAKDSQEVILKCQSMNLGGTLSPQDVSRFQKIDQVLNE